MNMPIPEVNTRHTAKDQTRFAALWRPALVQAFVNSTRASSNARR